MLLAVQPPLFSDAVRTLTPYLVLSPRTRSSRLTFTPTVAACNRGGGTFLCAATSLPRLQPVSCSLVIFFMSLVECLRFCTESLVGSSRKKSFEMRDKGKEDRAASPHLVRTTQHVVMRKWKRSTL